MKDTTARLHVTLLDVDPAIWRRIEVPAGFTLKALHDALQRAMGWFDGHLHHFEIGGILYGEPSPDDAEFDRDIVNERKTQAAWQKRAIAFSNMSTTMVITGAVRS
jgi:pRiA4b ORF-3-like protein